MISQMRDRQLVAGQPSELDLDPLPTSGIRVNMWERSCHFKQHLMVGQRICHVRSTSCHVSTRVGLSHMSLGMSHAHDSPMTEICVMPMTQISAGRARRGLPRSRVRALGLRREDLEILGLGRQVSRFAVQTACFWFLRGTSIW